MHSPSAAKPPTQDVDADALGFAAARHICRRDARDFYLASFFLPREKRNAASAVFAFCEMIWDAFETNDDAIGTATVLREIPVVSAARIPSDAGSLGDVSADSCCGEGTLGGRLALIRDRIADVYDDRLELPSPASRSQAQHALHAFALTVRRYGIPRQHFLDLAEGHRADLTVRRYATWASLERHCHRVSGVVALAMCGVLGVTSSEAGDCAVRMGNAMRLTSILRDLKQDHERGWVYFPLEDMARFRYSERDLAAGTANDSFRELMRFEIERARSLYFEAAKGIRWLADDGSRLCASMVAVTHSGLLDAIEREDFDVFRSRVRLTAAQKLARLPRAWRLARGGADDGVPENVF